MHIFASVSEHLNAQGDIFVSCLPLVSMSQWNHLGLFCSQNGRLHTAIRPRITAISAALLAHKVYEESDWLGSLETPDHLLEAVTPRAPQGYPNFSTGEEKSGHHNIFWLIFFCPADPSSFPQGKHGFTSGRRELHFSTSLSVQVSRHGVQLLLHPSLYPEWGLALPPHPPLPGFIHQLQKEDWLQLLPTTHTSSCRWLLSGRARVHNLASTHLSGSAGCN